MNTKPKLYLIPTPLGESDTNFLPQYVIDIIHSLDIFIAEKAKTARRFIKSTHPPKAINELTFFELNKQTSEPEWRHFLEPIQKSKSIGLLSEAGCPGVADPGAVIVEMAHQKDIEVVPLVGPSSILLALMASGMNGQSFSFQGYLSRKTPNLIKDLKRLEKLALRQKQTQIFIETPYRNQKLMEQMLKTLNPSIRICIAMDLSLPTQFIKTKTVRQWQQSSMPDLHKRPAVFLVYV